MRTGGRTGIHFKNDPYNSGTMPFIWDEKRFNLIANRWIKEWESKIGERELIETVGRATSDRRDTFRIA